MEAIEIQRELEDNIKKFCHHCICKTCLIAEVNGGAPGCGDCYKCSNEGYNLFCQSCSDYYNCDSIKGMNLNYLYRKAVESMKLEEESVLSKEEMEKVVENFLEMTMKTIVEGNLEITKEYKYFECLNCGWVGKADKTEYTYCGDQKEGDCWSVKCPCCGHKAYDIQQRNRLNQIIDEEIKMQQQESNYWENR